MAIFMAAVHTNIAPSIGLFASDDTLLQWYWIAVGMVNKPKQRSILPLI
jgi:hypothetical protein